MESTRLEFEVGALCETETTHERSQKEDKKKIEEGEKEREREREKKTCLSSAKEAQYKAICTRMILN